MRLIVAILCALLIGKFCYAAPSDSVVTIYVTKSSGSSHGSGFVFNSGGRIATAYHVIEGATKIEVQDKSFRKISNVRVERIDYRHDLAVLIAEDAKDIPALRFASARLIEQLPIKIAGTLRGMPKQVLHGRVTTDGFVSSTSIVVDGRTIFEEKIDILPIDITAYHGMSGSPVLTQDDEFVGVFSGSFSDGRGFGWAIPQKYLTDLMATSPLNKRASEISTWPQLSLMKSSWQGLNKSYTQQYSTEHMANLDALDASLKRIGGAWEGYKDEQRTVKLNTGKCTLNMREFSSIKINSVNQARATIQGKINLSQKIVNVTYLGTQDPGCPKDNNLTISEISGIIEISINDLVKFSQDNALFQSVINVTDCTASNQQCPASLFGKKSPEKLEIISSNKIRFANTILSK
jgi:serine protease Do